MSEQETQKIPISNQLGIIRNHLAQVRGELQDLRHNSKGWGERWEPVEGSITVSLVMLYHIVKELQEFEIKADDEREGESFAFNIRGIGLDNCPGCFVCGGQLGFYKNISAFVKAKEEGEIIVSWFKTGAYLDFRKHEPGWIQVKIGACDKHTSNLENLMKLGSIHNIIREAMIKKAIEFKS